MTIEQIIDHLYKNIKIQREYKEQLVQAFTFLEPYCNNYYYDDFKFIFDLKTGYQIKFNCLDGFVIIKNLEAFKIFKHYIDNQTLQDLLYLICYNRENILMSFYNFSVAILNKLNNYSDELKQQLLELLQWFNDMNIAREYGSSKNKYYVYINEELLIDIILPFFQKEELEKVILYFNSIKPYINNLLYLEAVNDNKTSN